MIRKQLFSILLSIGAIAVLTIFGTLLLLSHKDTVPTTQISTISQTLSPPTSTPTSSPVFSPIPSANSTNIKININTATVDELDRLDGIGPTLAQRIIEYRTNKPFKTIYDLKKISGIGDKKFEKIEHQITVCN